MMKALKSRQEGAGAIINNQATGPVPTMKWHAGHRCVRGGVLIYAHI